MPASERSNTAATCETARRGCLDLPPEGLEQYRESSANQGAVLPGAAKCAAIRDEHLAAVLAAWPRLSAQARAGVAGLANALANP